MNAAAAGMEIRGIAIPLQEQTLLLPNEAVIDIIGDRELVPLAGAPDWVAGATDWQRRRLIVVQFERLLGQPWVASSQRRRIVVCQSLSGNTDYFLGIIGLSIPRLVRISADQMHAQVPAAELAQAPIQAVLRFNGAPALIPDLLELERRLEDFT